MKKIMAILYISIIYLNAHQINLFGLYENGEIYVEGFYVNGNACSECTLNIIDSNKNKFEKKLNKDGKLQEKLELIKPIELTLIADSNHVVKYQIQQDEESNKIQSTTDNLTQNDLKEFIRGELKREFELMKIEMTKNNTNIDKIVSALGYIFGIFGLWLYFKRR